MLKRIDSVLLIVILYLSLVGTFSGAEAGIKEFVIFALLSALLIASSFLIRHYYPTDKNSLKQRFISICISFVNLFEESTVDKSILQA